MLRLPTFFGGAPLSAVYSLVSGVGIPAPDTGTCKIVLEGVCSVFVGSLVQGERGL